NNNCAQLVDDFISYEDAVNQIRNNDFKISESVNTSKSSWVRGAHFYSCDGVLGYFIIQLDNREYIHANMPIGIWQQFTNANSFGSFYDRNIKGRYQLHIH
ncbi:MAG: KTSC domain-containing protein, partial [Bacteroidota bacterium]|nr:KTSC domain-containing protein [Bacteroidota bacterium]